MLLAGPVGAPGQQLWGAGGKDAPWARPPAPRPARAPPPPARAPAGEPPPPSLCAPRAPRRRRPKGGRAAPRRRRPYLLPRPPRGSAPATTKRGELSPRAPGRGPAAPAAAALPTPRAPSAGPACAARRRLPEPPADRVHLPGTGRWGSRALRGRERDTGGDTQVERPGGGGGAGAAGGIAPCRRRPRRAPDLPDRSSLGEAFPLTRHVYGSLRGRRRDAPPPRGSGDGAAACPIAVSVCSRARTSAPPFKRRRRRRRRRRRKQQLSGKRLQPSACSASPLRIPSAAERSPQPFAAPGLAGLAAWAAPTTPGPEGGKGGLRPPAPRLPAAPAPPQPGAARPACGSRPKVRFIYLFPVEDVGAGAAGWLEGAFSVEADRGREGASERAGRARLRGGIWRTRSRSTGSIQRPLAGAGDGS